MPDVTTTADPGSSILRGIALALAAFALFSLHDAVLKSISTVHVFQIVFFVVLFSFVPFVFMLAFDNTERSLRPRLPGMIALRCSFSTFSLLGAFYAFGQLPMAEAYSLLFSAPILITLLSIPVLGERVRAIRWFAILLGMVGIVIVLNPTSDVGLSKGHIAAMVAAMSIACTSVVTRKIGHREHSVTLILYPMLCNIIVSGILLLFVYQPMPADVLLKTAIIGLISVIAQALLIRAYRTAEAQFIAPMQYSQMLWAIFYGYWVFNEELRNNVVIGATIIVLSGILFIWRELTASVGKPVLSTRNVRIASGPQATPVEADNDAR